MDQTQIDETLTDIFRTIFRNPELRLADELTAKDVPGWDSLNHVNLIMQIEEEFDVKFRNHEVAKLSNVGQLRALLTSKLGS